MKKHQAHSPSRSRTSPATLATVAGAAVCLSAVSNDAAAEWGKAGQAVVNGGASVTELHGKIRVANLYGGQTITVKPKAIGVTSAAIATNHNGLVLYPSGDSCMIAVLWNTHATVPSDGDANTYIKLRFKVDVGLYRYAWSQFNRSGTTFFFGPWSFSDSDNKAIKTLADSLTVTRLPLADGSVMFHWANLQEDGLAAYHLQKQSVGGGWEEVESFAPGTDNYTIKVSGDGKFRILAEQVDGQSTSREF